MTAGPAGPGAEPGPGAPPDPVERRTGGRLFWAGVVVGWALVAVGIRGMLSQEEAANPAYVARVMVGAAIVHDLVLAPLVCGLALLLGRLVKPPVRALVQAGLIASALVSLYSWPFVRGYGRAPTNPSALPQNYGRGLVIVLAAIWVVVAALAALAARQLRRRRSTA